MDREGPIQDDGEHHLYLWLKKDKGLIHSLLNKKKKNLFTILNNLGQFLNILEVFDIIGQFWTILDHIGYFLNIVGQLGTSGDHFVPFCTILHHFAPFCTIFEEEKKERNFFWQFWTIFYLVGPFRTTLDHFDHKNSFGLFRPFWTILEHFGPLWTIFDYLGPFWAILDRIGPCWTNLDHFGSF